MLTAVRHSYDWNVDDLKPCSRCGVKSPPFPDADDTVCAWCRYEVKEALGPFLTGLFPSDYDCRAASIGHIVGVHVGDAIAHALGLRRTSEIFGVPPPVPDPKSLCLHCKTGLPKKPRAFCPTCDVDLCSPTCAVEHAFKVHPAEEA